MANVKKVTISVSPTAELSYSPDPVCAKRRDKIWWECDHPFGIVLPGKTPFKGRGFSSMRYEGKHHVVESVLPNADNQDTTYPYKVTVQILATIGRPKVIKSHSPDIIIKRTG